MHKKYFAIVVVVLTVWCGAFSSFTTPALASDTNTVASVPAQVYTAAETAEFIKLDKATLEALAAAKSTEMVAKLTDLETAWDDKESVLKPKGEATWMILDKTLDKAISSLRSSHTNLEKGKAALEDLLKKLNQATKS
jgi:prefoldin subunit 5